MKTLITNGQIITPAGTVGGWLLYENGKILEIGTGECPSADETIDAEGRYVSPGFIDIHTHGAGGADSILKDRISILFRQVPRIPVI